MTQKIRTYDQLREALRGGGSVTWDSVKNRVYLGRPGGEGPTIYLRAWDQFCRHEERRVGPIVVDPGWVTFPIIPEPTHTHEEWQ